MHGTHNRNITHVAAGSAVVSPTCNSIERLLTLHTHCHFVVTDPARGALSQLSFLPLKEKKLTHCGSTDMCGQFNSVQFDPTLTDTSSTSFSAFLNDSFFCWKISMVAWKAWKRISTTGGVTLNLYEKKEELNGKITWKLRTLIQSALSCSELMRWRKQKQNSV